jgi:hypothetical protein
VPIKSASVYECFPFVLPYKRPSRTSGAAVYVLVNALLGSQADPEWMVGIRKLRQGPGASVCPQETPSRFICLPRQRPTLPQKVNP